MDDARFAVNAGALDDIVIELVAFLLRDVNRAIQTTGGPAGGQSPGSGSNPPLASMSRHVATTLIEAAAKNLSASAMLESLAADPAWS